MSRVTFTGERLHAGSSLFGVDLVRHRAPYVHALDFAQGGRVLDLGCGSGYGTAEIAEALPRVVALDRIPADPENLRRNIDWVRADLRGNPFASASFQLILSFQVIEHLDDPHVYLGSISRLLVPGGIAIITTPNLVTSDKINPFHVHEYEARELGSCLARYFDEVEMKGVGMSESVKPYFDARLARIGKVMRFDPWGIRNLLPKPWLTWLFSKGALWVRRGIQESDGGMPDAGLEDFPIGPASPKDIDLLAICRKNAVPERVSAGARGAIQAA